MGSKVSDPSHRRGPQQNLEGGCRRQCNATPRPQAARAIYGVRVAAWRCGVCGIDLSHRIFYSENIQHTLGPLLALLNVLVVE